MKYLINKRGRKTYDIVLEEIPLILTIQFVKDKFIRYIKSKYRYALAYDKGLYTELQNEVPVLIKWQLDDLLKGKIKYFLKRGLKEIDPLGIGLGRKYYFF